MFELKGKIEFEPVNVSKKHYSQSTWKKVAIVKFECDIYAYYSWFLERRFNLKLNPPLRGTHITIINDIVEDDIYEQAKELFKDKELTFYYDPTIIRSNSKGHWWLKVNSDDAHNIRSAMGLDPNPYFGLHLTVGLSNPKYLDHSKYITEQCIRFNL